MAAETWEITVDSRVNFASFPTTGTYGVLYLDRSTGTEDDPSTGTYYYWSGASYSIAVGSHPHPKPH